MEKRGQFGLVCFVDFRRRKKFYGRSRSEGGTRFRWDGLMRGVAWMSFLIVRGWAGLYSLFFTFDTTGVIGGGEGRWFLCFLGFLALRFSIATLYLPTLDYTTHNSHHTTYTTQLTPHHIIHTHTHAPPHFYYCYMLLNFF